jgi:hypothetical protein
MLTENKIHEIRMDVASAHYFGLISAKEGRTFMSLISTRSKFQ